MKSKSSKRVQLPVVDLVSALNQPVSASTPFFIDSSARMTPQEREILEIAAACGKSASYVRGFHENGELALCEIKDFVLWRGRLPDTRESGWILKYGVYCLKNYFDPKHFK